MEVLFKEVLAPLLVYRLMKALLRAYRSESVDGNER